MAIRNQPPLCRMDAFAPVQTRGPDAPARELHATARFALPISAVSSEFRPSAQRTDFNHRLQASSLTAWSPRRERHRGAARFRLSFAGVREPAIAPRLAAPGHCWCRQTVNPCCPARHLRTRDRQRRSRRDRASRCARSATSWTLRPVSRSQSWPFPPNAGLPRLSPKSIAEGRPCRQTR